jgi:hypothetical protein
VLVASGGVLSAIVLAVLSTTNVSLTLAAGLKCPTRASLMFRLERVGLHVSRTDAAFEVKLVGDGDSVHVTARRLADGQAYDRSIPSTNEECGTVERLVVALIHSWVQVRVPAVYPPSLPRDLPPDGGSP